MQNAMFALDLTSEIARETSSSAMVERPHELDQQFQGVCQFEAEF